MKKIHIIFIFIVSVSLFSCKKETTPEPTPEYVCWVDDYTISTDTSIYFDGFFRFRVGNNWTYKRTNNIKKSRSSTAG